MRHDRARARDHRVSIAPAAAGLEGPAPSEGGVAGCSPAAFDTLTRALRDYFCDDAEGSIASTELASCEDIAITLYPPSHPGRGLDARVVQFATPTEGASSSGRVLSLLVCAPGRTEAFLLEDLWSVTDEEATVRAEGTVSDVELLDLIPGGASEPRVDVVLTNERELWHGCIVESERTERTIVCAAGPTGPRCADVPTLYRALGECDELCLIRQLEDDDPDCEAEGTAGYERELRVSLELDEGRARIAETHVLDVPVPAGLVGDHTIEELLSVRAMEPLSGFADDD